MKVGIGLVLSGGYAEIVPKDFMLSLLDLEREVLQGRANKELSDAITDFVLIRSHAFPTDVGRNDICSQALAAGVHALLFLDCDHVFDANLLTRLLLADKDIVTARYHVKVPPYHPNLYVRPKATDNAIEGDFRPVHYGKGLFPVDRCGAGALLVKWHVLNTIGFPWFRYQPDPRPPHDLRTSEDFYFCQRAQEEGFTIWADWETEAKHLVRGQVTGKWYTEYLQPLEQQLMGDQPELAEPLIVCGYPDGYTLPDGQVIPAYVPAER